MASHPPVPPVDDTELGDLLTDLTTGSNIHPGIRLIASGIRLIGDDITHSLPETQLLLAQLAGSPDALDVIGAVGQLIARLTDHNPALRGLPDEQRKKAAHQGWLTSHNLNDPELRDTTANANAHLDR